MMRKLLFIIALFSIVFYGARAAPLATPIPLPALPVTIHITRATSDGQLTAWTVRCGYAISGMFCSTQRLTLYTVAICIFCFRFHDWLTAVGTAYIVTYTVTTAIYGFALAVDPALGSDADFVMVGKLLGIALFMTFFFARFAPHIFKINVAPALALWAGITLTAFVVVMIRDNTFYSHFYGVRAVEVCNAAGICVDTCSAVMPSSKFRGPTDEILPIQSTKRLLPMPVNASLSINEFLEAAVNSTAKLPSHGYHADNSFDPKSILFLVAWLLAFVNWVSSPRDIRDEILRAIVKKNVAEDYITKRSRSAKNKRPSTKQSQPANSHNHNKETSNTLELRVGGAKAIATFCYVLTTLALFSFPGIFVWSIIQAEIVFRSSMFIEQEGPRNVGQWGSCVGVALAAIAAIFDRLSGRTSDHIDIWAWHKVEQPPEAERPWWLFKWELGWLWYILNKDEWRNFVLWWKDPVRVCWPSLASS